MERVQWHINKKELYTVCLALLKYRNLVRTTSIMLQVDIRTFGLYIRNQRGTISLPLLLNQENSVTSQETANRSHLILHLRAVQHHSRQTFEGPVSTGLAFRLQDKRNHISEMGCPESGPVCFKPIKNCTSLCFNRRKGPGSAVYQCLQQAVELSASLDISSSTFNTQGFTSSDEAKGLLLLVVPKWQWAFWRGDLKHRAVAAPSDSRHGPPSCGLINESSLSVSEQHYFRGLEGM